MPPPITIRLLAACDLALMRAMLRMFDTAFEEDDRAVASPPDDEYLTRLLSRADFIALTATSADRVVGGLVAYVLTKCEEARSEVYIYDLAVDEAFRRQGIASELLRAVKREAKTRGASVVFVQAHAEDAPAIALYQRFGERADVVHFTFEVDDASDAS